MEALKKLTWLKKIPPIQEIEKVKAILGRIFIQSVRGALPELDCFSKNGYLSHSWSCARNCGFCAVERDPSLNESEQRQ
jgi:lipoate synthase